MLNPTKESERLVYLEPNDLPAFKCAKVLNGGNPTNITWAPEDLNIAVDLRVIIPTREYKASIADGVNIAFLGQNKGGFTSWFQGTKLGSGKDGARYLTDDYTAVSYQEIVNNKAGSAELLGINSINVTFDSNFYPRVTMTMTDVRGSSLMMPEEQRELDIENGVYENDACKNFFSSVFRFPYPRFLLSLKGIYGTFVTFSLSVESFKASFNSDSGNFDVTIKFIGEKFGVYTDIPFNFLLIAPYIGATDGTTSKYWQDETTSGRFKYMDGSPILTFSDYLKKFRETSTNAAELLLQQEAVSSVRLLMGVNDAITLIENKLNELLNLGDAFLLSTNWTYRDGNILTCLLNKMDHKNLFTKAQEKVGEINDAINDFNITYGSVVSSMKNLNSVFSESNGKVYIQKKYMATIDVTDENKPMDETLSNIGSEFPTEYYNKDFPFLNQLVSKPGIYETFIVDFSSYFDDFAKIREEAKTEKEKIEGKASEEVGNVFTSSLGFDPTLENVFRMIYAHLDAFMHEIYTLIQGINEDKRTIKSVGLTIDKTDVESASGSAAHLPPFPAVYRESTNGIGLMEKIYPGLDNHVSGMREISFIDSLYNGLNEINNVFNEPPAPEEDNGSSGGGPTYINPSEVGNTYWDIFKAANNESNSYTLGKEVNLNDVSELVSFIANRVAECIDDTNIKGDVIDATISAEVQFFLFSNLWAQMPDAKKRELKSEINVLSTSPSKSGLIYKITKKENKYTRFNGSKSVISGIHANSMAHIKKLVWTEDPEDNTEITSTSSPSGAINPTTTSTSYYRWGNRVVKESQYYSPDTFVNSLKSVTSFDNTVKNNFLKELADFLKFTGESISGRDTGVGIITNIPFIARIFAIASVREIINKKNEIGVYFFHIYTQYLGEDEEDWAYQFDIWYNNELAEDLKKIKDGTITFEQYVSELVTRDTHYYFLNTHEDDKERKVTVSAEKLDVIISKLNHEMDVPTMEENAGTTSEPSFLRTSIPTEDEEKAAFYYSLKNLYDRWIPSYTEKTFKLPSVSEAAALKDQRFKNAKSASYDNSSYAEYSNFIFVDSVFNDIGNKFKVNPDTLAEILLEQFRGHSNFSVLEFISQVCFLNKLHFQCMPVFNNFYNSDTFADIFTPFSPYDSNSKLGRGVGNTYVVMYTYASSHNLNVKYEKSNGVGYKSDALSDMLMTNNATFTERALKVFRNKGDGYRVAAFGVTPGMQNQSYFTKISIGMDNPRVTDLEIMNRMKLSEEARMGGMLHAVGGGQNTFSIYSSKAYDCTLEMPGCVNLMPTMFFQLNNMPLFNGLYRILKVEHNVQNNTMTTKVTGQRQSIYAIPLNEREFTLRNLEYLFQGGAVDLSFVGNGDYTVGRHVGQFYTLENTGKNGNIFVNLPNISDWEGKYEFHVSKACNAAHGLVGDPGMNGEYTYHGKVSHLKQPDTYTGICVYCTSSFIGEGLIEVGTGKKLGKKGLGDGIAAAASLPVKYGFGLVGFRDDMCEIYMDGKRERLRAKPGKCQAGDVCIMRADWTPSGGHACFYDGQYWISDTAQKSTGIWVYGKAKKPSDLKNTDIMIFRYCGNIVN